MRIKYCLLGIPDHQGVYQVGGRLGAALGPASIRKALGRMSGGILDPLGNRVSWKEILKDEGDVDIGLSVEKNHEAAALRVQAIHDQGTLESPVKSLILGGGHDHGYSQLKGIERWGKSKKSDFQLGCINIDAHLDVRKPQPRPSSGSPFYLAIEGKVLDPKDLIEFGIQSQCNAPVLWDYIETHQIEVVHWDELRSRSAQERVQRFRTVLDGLTQRCDAVVLSLDLDAIAEAHCPGVSAPQAEGFFPEEVLGMIRIASQNPQVISLGIFELNPLHDPLESSARLAATAVYRWIESEGHPIRD